MCTTASRSPWAPSVHGESAARLPHRLGVFSSATQKTVQHALAAIHGHLRSRGLACSFEVVLHRGHCRPATVSTRLGALMQCTHAQLAHGHMRGSTFGRIW